MIYISIINYRNNQAHQLSKPGSSTEQFSPKLAKTLKFLQMILFSLVQHLTNLKT